MNKNILGFYIAVFACALSPLHAQQTSTATAKSESNHGRVERVDENGKEYLRFFDKNGSKVKELRLGTNEVKARLGKNKRFNAANFGLKISTDVVSVLKGRAASGREVEVMRRVSKSAEVSRNNKYVVVQDSRVDFVEYADALDSERFNDAVESETGNTVYSMDGAIVLTLTQDEGRVASVSNTGKYFLINLDDSKGKIVNEQKEMLAQIPFIASRVYFSDNDRFIILVEKLSSSGFAINVFDTRENKLELGKLSVADSVFKNFEEMDISEDKREIVIPHFWDIKTRQIKIDRLQF